MRSQYEKKIKEGILKVEHN